MSHQEVLFQSTSLTMTTALTLKDLPPPPSGRSGWPWTTYNKLLPEKMGWVCLPPFDPKTLIYNVCSETAFWQRSAMKEVGLLKTSLQFAIDLEFFGRLY